MGEWQGHVTPTTQPLSPGGETEQQRPGSWCSPTGRGPPDARGMLLPMCVPVPAEASEQLWGEALRQLV